MRLKNGFGHKIRTARVRIRNLNVSKCKIGFVFISQFSPLGFRRKENSVERLSWMQWATPYLPVTPSSWFFLQVI
jgi:hypothetical protein